MTRLIIPSLTTLANAQDGVLSAADLLEAGLNRRQIRHRVAQGWLRRVASDVFCINGSVDTHRQRLRIGLTALGDRSWVSYEAAASLHGLDRADSSAVEFTIERGRSVRTVDFTVHTSSMIEPIDSVVIDGLRTMSATRTVIDLAHARAGRRRVEAAMDSAVRLGLSHPEVIARRLETLRGSGRWGCTLIDRILPDAGGHSPIERSFLQIVSSSGFDRPETQVIFRTGDGTHIARVDFFFREQRLVVEVTGRLGHVSDAERSRDAQRRNELQDLGLKVVEYTSTQLRDQRAWIRSDLRRRLGRFALQ